jgi:hypothetical protein
MIASLRLAVVGSIATTLSLAGCGSHQASTTGSGGASTGGGAAAGGAGGSSTGGGSSSGGGAPAGFPDATNTGYKNAPGYPGSLKPWNGGQLQDGHTYSFIDFPGGLAVGGQSTPKTGIKFVGCRFHGANPGGGMVLLYGNDISFDHCTFEPDVEPPQNVSYDQSYQYGLTGNGGYYTHIGKLTVTACDLWGWGNAIDVNPTTDATMPQVYRDNWIHHAADVQHAVYHHDGIGAESGASSGSYVTLDHNTIESLGNTNAVAYQATGPYSHFTITNNLFGGFGYTVAILGGATYVTFTGNTFSTRIQSVYGPLYPDDFWTKTGSVWKNNKWMVPPGAAWGNPAHDGWFWLPTAGSVTDDSGYVSKTDYSP